MKKKKLNSTFNTYCRSEKEANKFVSINREWRFKSSIMASLIFSYVF